MAVIPLRWYRPTPLAHGLSGGMHYNQIRREWIQQYVDGHWKMDPKPLFQCQLFPVTPLASDDLLKLVRCSCSSEIPCNTRIFGSNSATRFAQCSVHVRVTDIVSKKEQGRPFRPVTMTTMIMRLSPEPRMHTMHISFHLPIPNEFLSRNTNN